MFAQADSYEQFMGRWSRQLAPLFATYVGIHDGDAVLDVGSGTGVFSFAVRAIDPTGTIEGIDLSPAYVEYASKQHPEAKIRFQVGNAQKLDFPNATFDVAAAMLVLNFVPDPAVAVAEMRRVTKPGGTLAAAVWDYGGEMEMLKIFDEEASAFDPGFVTDERRMPLGKAEALHALFERGGLEHVETTAIDTTLHFTSFDDYWKPFLLGTGPGGAYVAKLSSDRRDQLAARLRKRLGDAAFDLKGRAWAVKAIVPK